MTNSVENALVQRKKNQAPKPDHSPSVSADALKDANIEAVRFLQDIALEIPYSDFAHRGMTIQNFLRTRQLAFHDVFEDIGEDVKAESIAKNGNILLDDLRMQDEYGEMCERFRKAAVKHSVPEKKEAWLERVSDRNRKNLERFARTADPEQLKDASRAASEILEREMPKASRAQIGTANVMIFNNDQAALLAKAFAEAKLPPPPIPVLESKKVEPDE